jgi:hypothetical protein
VPEEIIPGIYAPLLGKKKQEKYFSGTKPKQTAGREQQWALSGESATALW